jgi:hypothetical protein
LKHFLLFYEAGLGYLERRPEFRGAHLKHAWVAHERGDLVVAGALADPVDGAVLMFQGRGSVRPGRPLRHEWPRRPLARA